MRTRARRRFTGLLMTLLLLAPAWLAAAGCCCSGAGAAEVRSCCDSETPQGATLSSGSCCAEIDPASDDAGVPLTPIRATSPSSQSGSEALKAPLTETRIPALPTDAGTLRARGPDSGPPPIERRRSPLASRAPPSHHS